MSFKGKPLLSNSPGSTFGCGGQTRGLELMVNRSAPVRHGLRAKRVLTEHWRTFGAANCTDFARARPIYPPELRNATTIRNSDGPLARCGARPVGTSSFHEPDTCRTGPL